MRRPLKKLLLLPLLLTTLSASSCGRAFKFNPDAWRASHHIQGIVSEREEVVYCDEVAFSEFAAMHKDKWIELRRLIQGSPLSSKEKERALGLIPWGKGEN
jgi:hypothetical protein